MEKLERQFESAFPSEKWATVPTLVAVSGGADSVSCLRVMASLGGQFPDWNSSNLIVGHINHGTRGAQSDLDSEFVSQLTQRLGLKYLEAKCSDSGLAGASEESLRNFRYSQLLELGQSCGARYLVMGHNFDDQVETILFRIFRGTGISGLAGIPRQRLASEAITIVRPLLESTREQIIDYLNQISQTYCVDSSNADSTYTRNYLRNDVLPNLKVRFGDAISDSIVRLGSQAKEINTFLDSMMGDCATAMTRQEESKIELNCDQLRAYSPLVVRHWLSRVWIEQNWPRQSMTFQWWKKICDSIQQPPDTVLNLPCSIRFEKTGSTAVFLDLRPSGGRSNGQ